MKVIFEHQSNPSGAGLLVKEYVQTYFTSPYHFHDLYELIWIKKSYGKLYAGKSMMNFQEGDIYLFGPGFGHCFYNEKAFIDQGEKAHAIAVFFREDFLGTNFLNLAMLTKTRDILTKSTLGIKIEKQVEEFYFLFEKMATQKGLDELITFLQLLNQISQLPVSSLQILNDRPSVIKITNKDSARLEPIIKYVMENFKNELDSKTAAGIVHLNEAAFCRYFKSRTEQTFSQFVNHVRITHATNLLITEDWDVLRICYESGFQNLSYFNRQFRAITGQSPREYRKSLTGKDENLMMDTKSD